MWCIHTHTHTHTHTHWNVTHRKNEIIPFVATWMDLEIITVRRQMSYDITYKIIQINLFTKQEQTDFKNKSMVTKGEIGGERIN